MGTTCCDLRHVSFGSIKEAQSLVEKVAMTRLTESIRASAPPTFHIMLFEDPRLLY
ncbi:uncharacterized protein FOMMEDRAFT_21951 [Fomitiporia mediterranea MF3/22]|uniref:uncharacterized protein n=1 Tax=Fomitiporia mediterranea (strain MF3/22) TaxID=694068 RepID=UPI00044097C1|nr:uncharacterized protein FOMMEDRAFT_21951 [Fomitiporia mediterranea MF3/22]EJD01592.1 hypothetical protein FOMMEDRAFT_21951 [Fomitiporia mediterranea MF3/22]